LGVAHLAGAQVAAAVEAAREKADALDEARPDGLNG